MDYRYSVFVYENNGKPLCLVSEKTLSVAKEYNLERHYKSRHEAKYDNIRGQESKDKVSQLKKCVRRWQAAITQLEGTDGWVKSKLLHCSGSAMRFLLNLLMIFKKSVFQETQSVEG